MKTTIRKDINGKELQVGDIIAECQIGQKIWNDGAVIVKRPLGVVASVPQKMTSSWRPEETDFYNIVQIREGLVVLTDNADEFLKLYAEESEYDMPTMKLCISRYDGNFYAWDNIEIVGTVNDYNQLTKHKNYYIIFM